MKVWSRLVFVVLVSCYFMGCKPSIELAKSDGLVNSPPVDTTNYSFEPFEPSNETIATFLTEYLNLKYKSKDFSKFIYVSVKYQRLYLIEADSVSKKYPISSALLGVGNKANSMKTPIGLHSIKSKYGDGVPLGGLFKSRVFTGKVSPIYKKRVKSPTDDVTTRIMWLRGEEPGLNRGRNIDSYKRYIYIHGTSEEGYIGEPQSHGCIRMRNTDVLELYSKVDEGTPVLILKQ